MRLLDLLPGQAGSGMLQMYADAVESGDLVARLIYRANYVVCAAPSFLAQHGTGSFLATTVTAPLDATLRSLSGLAKLHCDH